MVPMRYEAEDGSGWTFGWQCGCNAELRDSVDIEQVAYKRANHSITDYVHHGNLVKVRYDLKGKHRDYCLCYSCEFFNPSDRAKNCKIANALYALCVDFGVVTPVWECPNYTERL
jgi:hypothetical protein